MLLSGNRSYSMDELTERFEISERTVYRYLNNCTSGKRRLPFNRTIIELKPEGEEMLDIRR